MTMPIPVAVVTVDTLPTVVIAETTSWEQFPSVWPKLLDEVYGFVRGCREFAAGDRATPQWQNVTLYRDQQGLKPAGPTWEIYGHWRPDPDELETEIYHLLH